MESRIGRGTYLRLSLEIVLIVLIVLLFIDQQEKSGSLIIIEEKDDFVLAFMIFTGILILTLLYLSTLRLQDINLSGWYVLLAIIPIVNLVGIALFFIRGTKGPNKYGPDPKDIIASKAHQKIIKQNSIDQGKYDLESNLTIIASQINLLDNALNSGLITEKEYNDKVDKLAANRNNIEFRLGEISENIGIILKNSW